jgi:predicted phosphodiesterase
MSSCREFSSGNEDSTATDTSMNIHTTDALENDEALPPMFRYHHLTDIEQVYCLSDLHTDHTDNIQWLRDQASSRLQSTDLVIVAGDISHDEATFVESMSILLDQCQVLFVPGNHEAWLSSSSSSSTAAAAAANRAQNENQSAIFETTHAHTTTTTTGTTSLDKLQRCYDVCRTMGVLVDPVYIGGRGNHPVWILPLQSWYDGTLTFDEELCHGFESWPWVDFTRCRWNGTVFPPMISPNARIPQGLVEYFLQQNRIHILQPWNALLRRSPELQAPSITVSHFAPNQQCLPDWKDLQASTFQTDAWLDHGAATMSAKFAKVAGTKLLDEQLRSSSCMASPNRTIHFPPKIHIFGHSHRPKDFVYRSIRYIHNPLGKPRERQLHMISPQVQFQFIWNVVQNGEVVGPTIIRYWEDFGGGKEMLWRRMANIQPGRYQT